MTRRLSKKIMVGSVAVGSDSPVSIQTMGNVDSRRKEATLEQLFQIQKAGCDIVRLAVPDEDGADIFQIAKKSGISIPMVADIHFDYRLALLSVQNGCDKVRINPGNIGEKWKVKQVADCCRLAGVPIRIGVNSGSLDKTLLKKYGYPSAEALAESALNEAEALESCGFSDIVLSIKSSTVSTMMEATRLVAKSCDYPIHLGVTEAGDAYSGMVKNAIGIGGLLQEGIGDTIRVSLTADPLEEIRAGKEILSSLGLNTRGGIQIVSCPTCGRTRIPLIEMARCFREEAEGLDTQGKTIKVAVMGCVVNGPGEAREADIGIAGGDGCCVIFKKNEIIGKVSQEDSIPALLKELQKMIDDEH